MTDERPDEAGARKILALSLAKFRWKTSGDIGRLGDLFDDDLHFVHITGHVSSKTEWIDELRSGRFVYESIEPKGASVETRGDEAVLTGRAVFTVRMGGHRGVYRLQFTQTYVRKDGGWKLRELLTSTY
ncbi:nuclear transport factor 2 family protein [Sinorhizobium medicae]|uniref:nuclear transport factor 2 family protein n=1 Tax=Sinorhizobium medicae TaxID=110321 RepID=UPI000FDA6219|nr:nuclear transport factor 2 family protein [Sinorhizobium medicae]RVO69947.1 nuclear transport factor 2 family protein [Sinorhizobium medicae]